MKNYDKSICNFGESNPGLHLCTIIAWKGEILTVRPKLPDQNCAYYRYHDVQPQLCSNHSDSGANMSRGTETSCALDCIHYGPVNGRRKEDDVGFREHHLSQ